MDLLPKQMCHRCSYKLEEFYDFYVNCAKTDTELKSQLSWMSKENLEEKIVTPMVKMTPFKIKMEPPDSESTDPKIFDQFNESSLFFPASFLQHSFEPSSPMITCSRCRCLCDRSIKVDKKSPQPKKCEFKNQRQNFIPVPHSSSEINENLKEPCEENPDNLKSKKMNRALRPRKVSVDYMGHKKKGSISNMKSKLKLALEMIDTELVKPVTIKIPQRELPASSPIIKLEKVDEQLGTMRKRKNLEEFNKRIKELQLKKKKDENRNKKFFQRRKSFQKEVSLRRKSFQSEHNSENHKKKNFPKDLLSRRSMHAEENLSNGDSSSILVNENFFQSLNSNIKDNSNDKVLRTMERQIKQEIVIKTLESTVSLDVKQNEKKSLNVSANLESGKSVDKFPLHAFVKLEKDYTCNVDYPRIKIKRHSAIYDLTKSENARIDSLENDSCVEVIHKKSPVKEVSSVSQKSLRKTEQRLKTKGKSPEKIQKEAKKKKKKKIEANVTKQIENNSSTVHDCKRKCEKCNASFNNTELYKLHPCYQN